MRAVAECKCLIPAEDQSTAPEGLVLMLCGMGKIAEMECHTTGIQACKDYGPTIIFDPEETARMQCAARWN